MPDHSPSPELEKLSPLERWFETEFKEAYETQAEIFQKVGLLEILPESDKMGIRGIDGKEYPIPSEDQIKEVILKNRETYEPKMNQGFTQIQLTPFGVPLEKLTTILEQSILTHHKTGKLLATKNAPDEPDEPLDLDTANPLYKWDGWIDPDAPEGNRGADVTGKCVYHPNTLETTNHGGHTKSEILATQAGQPWAGWEVKLLESNVNIPSEGQGKTIGGRKQLSANQTPTDYLNRLQTDPQYQNEQSLTNEDWLTQFITHLEKTNQVIDDYSGNGKACFLPGSFIPSSRRLGGGYWVRGDRRAVLYGSTPGNRFSSGGLRSAVGIKN
jgi:hypothetical protein